MTRRTGRTGGSSCASGPLFCGLIIFAASIRFAAPPPASAQDRTTTFRAQVVDSIAGDPIAGVLVRFDSGTEAVSDDVGRITVEGLDPGEHTLALLTADCRVTWARVDLAVGVTREIELRLPPVFGAAALRAHQDDADRRRAKGKILVAEEIDRMNARSATDLVRRLAPSMVRGWSGVVGEPASVSGRAPSSIIGDADPVLVVDGARVHDVAYMLDQLLPSEVDTLEVLPGAAGGWEFGSQGASGVIRIVRRRGIASGSPETVEAKACSVPGFSGAK
jgi:hypothetical protein